MQINNYQAVKRTNRNTFIYSASGRERVTGSWPLPYSASLYASYYQRCFKVRKWTNFPALQV